MKAQEFKKICKVCKKVVASGFITCPEPIEYITCRECEERTNDREK